MPPTSEISGNFDGKISFLYTFTPCCGRFPVLQFSSSYNLDYSDGNLYWYNGQCYSLTIQRSDGEQPLFPVLPIFGGALISIEATLENTAYLISNISGCEPNNCVDNNLVVNGSFDTDLSSWELDTPNAKWAWNAGVARYSGADEGGTISQNVFTIGKEYRVTFTICITYAVGTPYPLDVNIGGNLFSYATEGCYTITETIIASNTILSFYTAYDGGEEHVHTLDDVCVIEINNEVCPDCISYNFVNCYNDQLVVEAFLTNPEVITSFPAVVSLNITSQEGESFINCWTVTEADTTITEQVVYTVISNHTDCSRCLDSFNNPPCIALTNCITNEVTIVSNSEGLIEYVGKVIKVSLNESTICYSVTNSSTCPEQVINFEGIIIDCFTECEDCVPKCSCTRAVNTGNIAKRLEYIDCNGITQLTEEIVGIGRRSKKYCTLEWTDPDVVEVINFGDCVDNICPEVPLPKRVVTPGYDTPICTPAQYERIVCRYAEIKFKEVLTKRYGIEDCCDDESLANDIKYELIHLQMLEDPEYVCVNNPTLCPPGCGYINMNIIHECPPEPEIYEYRLTIDGIPNPAAGSVINYTDENDLPQSYTVVASRTPFEITFCAVYGSITINSNAYYASNEPCPTGLCPAVAGLLLERIGDCPV